MDHKEAIEILIKMLDTHPVSAEEKQAVLTAIGVLGWTSLAQSKIKARKAKREKGFEKNLRR